MKDDRPNIVFIITDQQRFDTINALGFPHMVTPNLDRLVREGVTFTNQFVSAPSCAPSRASLFTGYYPHTTGIFKNGDTWQRSWIELLSASGYHCTNIGKMHTNPFETPLGFHERFVVENKDRFLEGGDFKDRWDMALQTRGLKKQSRISYRTYPDYEERVGAFTWDLPEETHSDFFVGDLASWWIENNKERKPFFLQVGFPGPHPPYDPVPRYLDLYKNKDFPISGITEEELSLQPPMHHEMRAHNHSVDHDSIKWPLLPSEKQLRNTREHYYANVTMIDEKVGDIIESLDKGGYLDNTIVIFTSDHGDCLGDHGQIQKWTMFDTIVRTPLIVWQPNTIRGDRRVSNLCQQFDIVPYILETAGVEVPVALEARNLGPFLRNESVTDFREFVFAEQARDKNMTGTEFMIMVRSTDWKLVYYIDNKDQGELYHLVSDPGETRNLYLDSNFQTQKNELTKTLLEWYAKSSRDTSEFLLPIR